MDHKKEKNLIDPDYVATSKALRLKKEKEKQVNKLNNEKLSNIIVEVFDEELSTRQKQLDEVEEKICKAQKLLHLVRYVLITSYYKNSNLEVPPDDEVVTPGFDKQNRLHPAVKKLLGSNPRMDIFCAGKGKRRLAARNCDTEGSTLQATETKKCRLEIQQEILSNAPTNSEQSYSKNRKKIRHRLVIGNVSKWVPSMEDNTTHKWMVYVRGDKDNPDVSNIIEKVTFFLHPSYKPHDVVEVQESPFHLARRGWGEFPLRVQIFFKCPLNKPISIVHNLKLEKTFTGRQTLGNETLVDVYLYEGTAKPETITRPLENLPSTSWCEYNENMDMPSTSYNNICTNFDSQINQNSLETEYTPLDITLLKSEPTDLPEFVKLEEICIKSEPLEVKSESAFGDSDHTTTNVDLISTRSDSAYGCSDTASMSFEHDYCDVIEEQFVDNEIEVKENLFLNQFLSEHSYSVLSGSENPNGNFENNNEGLAVIINTDGDNKLAFGLGETYLKEKIVNVHNVVPKNLLILQRPQQRPQIYLLNGHINSRSLLLSNTLVALPDNKFKNIGEAMPFLLKRYKLWNENVRIPEFKSKYPYLAVSQQEFNQWPFGKRLNSEWNRAREIKKILAEKFPALKKWNTRTCFMYARSHKYSPVHNLGNFLKYDTEDSTLINECFSNSIRNTNNIDNNHKIDVDVDVESNEKKSRKSQKTYIDISDSSLKYHCAFVKEAALDCGVVLRSEEISDGVILNGAERMILEAVKCLAEGLVRRANHHLVCRQDYREGQSEVTTEEVKIALRERSEIQSIRTFQKKKRQIEYFK